MSVELTRTATRQAGTAYASPRIAAVAAATRGGHFGFETDNHGRPATGRPRIAWLVGARAGQPVRRIAVGNSARRKARRRVIHATARS